MIDLEGQVIYHEALIRIVSQNGTIPPKVFLNIAKQKGFYTQMVQLIIEKVGCVRGAKAINISCSELFDDELYSLYLQSFENDGTIFELQNEEGLNNEELPKKIEELKNKNIQICLDNVDSVDFLKKQNVDFVKVQGNLIRLLKVDEKAVATCKEIISTCKEKNIEEKIKNLFGLKELIVLKNGALMGDDTDSHIDTLARFIDKETITYVKCYDERDIHFEELNKMEEELKKTNFRLIPLPLPTPKMYKNHRLPATYLNFVFINGALIVPTYNDVNDKEVIKILKKEIKNREIIEIDASIFIREYGSLHCSCISQMLQI